MEIPPEAQKSNAVCRECVAMGSHWVHLRICLTCGHIGCCDSSPNRHARQHWRASLHPIVGSMEPAERWTYCFEDDEFL
ncbi:UBP-type zinc finger domain-containing protein [Paracoccus aestuariivivens]|nr:UBP-type zinc finger domain-containing protein [Paracoccus aestuariivivens]